MFFPSSRNVSGLTGSKITHGDAIGMAGQWAWNLADKARHMGIPDANNPAAMEEFRKAVTEKNSEALAPFSGIYLAPKMGDGTTELKGEIPLEFGGRTYQVGPKGIKIVNEKMLDEIVTESIERENYITDVCEMFLYAGDSAVALVSDELFKLLKEGGNVKGLKISRGCLPSNIRHTTDAAQYGAKYLDMKNAVNLVIDRIVIPEATLEKSRSVQKHGINAQRLRTEAGAGVSE